MSGGRPTERLEVELTGRLAGALSAHDLRAATRLFARDACFLTPDATAIRGREEIHPVLAQLIDAGTRVRVVNSSRLSAGDLVISHERWEISIEGGGLGQPYRQLSDALLLWRNCEGAWRVAIAAPWYGRGGRG